MNGKLAILPQKLIEMLMTADREKFKEVVTNLVKKHNPLAVAIITEAWYLDLQRG